METQIHDDVLLAPSIMINIGTNVGPVMTNTASVFTHIRAHIIQTTHHTNNVQQFGAKGDVQIRRSPDGFLVVPEHLLFGSKTFAEKTEEFIGERKPSERCMFGCMRRVSY